MAQKDSFMAQKPSLSTVGVFERRNPSQIPQATSASRITAGGKFDGKEFVKSSLAGSVDFGKLSLYLDPEVCAGKC